METPQRKLRFDHSRLTWKRAKARITNGQCRQCGKFEIFQNGMCRSHYDIHKTYSRNYYRKKMNIPIDAELHEYYNGKKAKTKVN